MSAARQAFDSALETWLGRQEVAEERLTSFAFREDQPPVRIAPSTSHDALGRWILGVVADTDVAAFLRALGDSGRLTAELTAEGVLGMRPGDRVALAARIGVLAAGGLVTRELESDRITVTDLGRAALALADSAALPTDALTSLATAAGGR